MPGYHLSPESAQDKATRIQAARHIQRHASRYVCCEQCGGISLAKHPMGVHEVCPNCHGYRINRCPKAVFRQAARLASRPPNRVPLHTMRPRAPKIPS